MDLMYTYLQKNLLELGKNNVQLRFIGDRSRLSGPLQETFAEAEVNLAANTGLSLNVAVNYGGRAEITRAARQIALAVETGGMRADDVTEELVASYLYTAPENDVDLLIRSGADTRISNYLLWQNAYAEFWFTPLCWPDFTKETLIEAIKSFQGRERRFGGLK